MHTIKYFQNIGLCKKSNESNKSQIFIAHINDAEGLVIDDYKLFGDQWRMDAGFIKMKYSVFKTPIGLMVREELMEPLKKEKNLLDKTRSLFGFE